MRDTWDDDDPFGENPASEVRHPGTSAGRSRDASDPFDDPGWADEESEAPARRSSARARRRLVPVVVAGAVVITVGVVLLRPDGDAEARPPVADRRAEQPVAASTTSTAPVPVSSPSGSTEASPSALATAEAQPTVGAAASTLATLDVKGRAGRADYDRDRFGQAWADVDRNGCDTRNDILRRDLSPAEIRPGTQGCLVERGVLLDPYSGEQIAFERGSDTSVAVQVDHVVSLSNAWQTGAFAWDDVRREQLANDPLNLLAVDGPLNLQKSDGDAATWLPPDRGYWCDLVARQVAVKAKYDLWVTPPEHDAIERVLERCPDQGLPLG